MSSAIRYITLHRVLFSPYVGGWVEAIAAGTEKVMSRHRNLNTLMIYDDNRHQHQSEVTNILADLV